MSNKLYTAIVIVVAVTFTFRITWDMFETAAVRAGAGCYCSATGQFKFINGKYWRDLCDER